MAVFQVFTRDSQIPAPLRRHRRRFPSQWYAISRGVIGMLVAGLLFTFLLLRFTTPQSRGTAFVLLPVFLSLAMAQFQDYNLRAFLKGTPLYLLLMGGLMFIYYGTIVLGVSFIQQGIASPVILISTALAWAIILYPVCAFIQKRLERRFNVRNQGMVKAIEAFTATLREEIDLAQLRERLLTVIQQAMQPSTLSLWIRLPSDESRHVNPAEQVTLADDDPFMAYLLTHPTSQEIERLSLDSPVLRHLKSHGAELFLPLTSQGELLGLLVLGAHVKGEAYTQEERTLLDTLAPQVAPALRVAQMVQEQQEQVCKRERIEQELRTAQVIQHSFLPEAIPTLPGWHISAYYQPAREVGGDFYDFISLPDGRLGLVIGDAADKGMPAALVMTTACTVLRTAAQTSISPGEVLARVNGLLHNRIPSRTFITCFYAILDPPRGHLCYANAGHELPYHQHHGGITELRATGTPLGMMPASQYEEYETTVAPGERLLFYSDGLVEAHNLQREMFGRARVKATLGAHAFEAPLIDVLLSELNRFTGGGWEQEDDVTLLTLQRS